MYIYLRDKCDIKNLLKKITIIVKECIKCKEYSKKIKHKILFSDYISTWKRIGIDTIVSLLECEEGNKYILIVTDYGSKYAITKAVRNKSKEEVANFVLNEVIFKYGSPVEIRMDNGKEFINNVMEELAKFWKIKLTKSPPYHPEANGLTERTNQSIIIKLSKIIGENKMNWDEDINMATFMYNISPMAKLGRSPFEILFGKECNLKLNAENIALTDVERNLMYELIKERRKFD
ncbi:POL4 [Hepatospora eriocheir]|uniref:POL4 n=1 Tax=Hepatospora eriocheir TaxID=1081669 RepID=A0A1X0Q7F0_9MICR|nr:POL4 [Hepatospora eriocheir]